MLGLNQLMGRDGITLADATDETRRAVSFEGEVVGLPCVNVSNLLLYRRDLLDRYSLPVPQSWDEVKSVGTELQNAAGATSPGSSTLLQAAEQAAAGMRFGRWGQCWVRTGASGRSETKCWSR